jgi:hypothetical protein
MKMVSYAESKLPEAQVDVSSKWEKLNIQSENTDMFSSADADLPEAQVGIVMCHHDGTNINVDIVGTHHHCGTLNIEDCNGTNIDADFVETHHHCRTLNIEDCNIENMK